MPRWTAFPPETARTLVKGLNAEDDRALPALYDAYSPSLFDYAVSLSGEVKAGEDIVHDVLVDAARRAPRLRDRDRFRSWLYGAARRRGLFRNRVRGVFWDWSGQADDDVDPATGLYRRELRQILEGSLDRLSFADQDLLLLTLRHCFEGPDLAAVLGTSVRRAAARAAKVRRRAEEALAAQVQALHLKCAGESTPHAAMIPLEAMAGPVGGGKVKEQHLADCVSCERRSRVPFAALMAVPPTLPPAPALRHRVLHTATDPELAGYRADIASRGGHLTTEGLPKQPDVPSELSRRYLLVGSTMAGLLGAAMIATLVIGPDLGLPGLGGPDHRPHDSQPPVHRPSRDGEDRSAQSDSVEAGEQRPGGPLLPSPSESVGEPVPTPQNTMPGTPSPGGTPTPSVSILSPPTPTAAPVIKIKVARTTVVIGARRTAEIELSAEGGTVHWSAISSHPALTPDADSGTIPEGGYYTLLITLRRSPIKLPGSGQISIINQDTGDEQVVTVSWPLSVL
ncbi:MAG: sigma-70 family RNA polymerase sigma factor [Streptosporangiaceae bacterium]